MVILEDGVGNEILLYYILLRGVSVTQFIYQRDRSTGTHLYNAVQCHKIIIKLD